MYSTWNRYQKLLWSITSKMSWTILGDFALALLGMHSASPGIYDFCRGFIWHYIGTYTTHQWRFDDAYLWQLQSLSLSTSSNTSKRFFNENKGFGALILAATLYFFRSWEPLEKLRWRHKKYQELVMRRQMMLLSLFMCWKMWIRRKHSGHLIKIYFFLQKKLFDKITTSVSYLILHYTWSSNR